MRRYLPATAVLLLVGAAFGLGRLSNGRAVPALAGDPSADLRQEMADLKTAVAGVRQTLAWIGARVAAIPTTGGAAGETAAPPAPCPPAGDQPVPPEEAAQAARARGDVRFQEGESIVASAMARGTWNARDIEQFRALQREAPGSEWVALMQKIDAAITAGKVQPDPELPAWH